MFRKEEELPTDDLSEAVEAVQSEYQSEYQAYGSAVMSEVSEVLSSVDEKEVNVLLDELLRAEKVFVIAVGRVFLALQCLAKRLAHLGINVEIVGSVTEKAITEKDLLLVASGSGESIIPLEIAKKSKNFGASIGLITSARYSSLKSLADFAVHLPCPTKNDPNHGVPSVQPMSTLFDQSLHVFGDVVALILQRRIGVSKDDLWKYHANLE